MMNETKMWISDILLSKINFRRRIISIGVLFLLRTVHKTVLSSFIWTDFLPYSIIIELVETLWAVKLLEYLFTVLCTQNLRLMSAWETVNRIKHVSDLFLSR